MSQGKVIVPFRIEDILPTTFMEYALSNVHWLDALTPPTDSHLASLVKHVELLLEQPKTHQYLAINKPVPVTPPEQKTHPVGPPPPNDGKDFIFISYKREDMPRIVPFLHRIVSWGFPIWYDRGIHGGKEWSAVIDDKVCGCKALLVFLSQAAVESKMVRREINLADSENLPILGIRLDNNIELKHGLKGIMTQYQTIDASEADFSDVLKMAIENVRIL